MKKRHPGESLQVGDEATTDFNGPIPIKVVITHRWDGTTSNSGIMFSVTPSLRGCEPSAKFDSHWFKPIAK